MNAKPFVKWVGGKGQLISQLDDLLPADFSSWQDVTYIEPFVGGGAMLFHMLQKYKNIRKAVINDINQDLTTCYMVVRDSVDDLLNSLETIQCEYDSLNLNDRREFFLEKRAYFNAKTLSPVENSTLFIFLNRTCFNGLYRVNKSGLFNVPFGKYKSPRICDYKTIIADSELLQGVEIMTGDFEKTLEQARGETLFYFDPPYRPLSNTANFSDYSKEGFDDGSQVRLKKFCDTVNELGYAFMLSNSDGVAKEPKEFFLDELYVEYNIERVLASRNVNSDATKRGKISEILVRNFN